MYCVLWTYKVPPQLTIPAIEKLFAEVAGNYLGIPGLVRKYFGFTEDGKSVIGIYLWTSRTAADAFYSPEWMAGVTQRWGAAPVKSEWTVPVVAECAEGKLVNDRDLKATEDVGKRAA
jgi:hypothetical protein